MKYDIKKIAYHFADVLDQMLEPGEIQEIVKRNNGIGGHCASHDFCDANEAMIFAFEIIDADFDLNNEDCLNAINSAWALARVHDFNVDNILEGIVEAAEVKS